MERTSARTDGNRFENGEDTQIEANEEPIVFEGETLRHSPQLGRRFVRWVSNKFE